MKKKTLKNYGWSALNVPFVERQTQLFKKRIETTVHCLLSQRSMAVWKAFQRIIDRHSKEHQMLKLSEMLGPFQKKARALILRMKSCLFAMNESNIRIHPQCGFRIFTKRWKYIIHEQPFDQCSSFDLAIFDSLPKTDVLVMCIV